ncbi:MAG: hypothetical protein ABI432_17525 [Flavobacteriales bacterium]
MSKLLLTHVRRILFLLFVLHALPGITQDRPSWKERSADRRQVRIDGRKDLGRWERMPQWSTGFVYGMGYSSKDFVGDQLEKVAKDRKPTFRAEASRRIRDGWYVQGGLEHTSFRTGGIMNSELLDSWSDGYWFGTYSERYEGDVVTVEHRVTTLNLMTGMFTAPFPRRRNVGMTLSAAGGLGVHLVTGDHGIARDQRFTVINTVLGDGTDVTVLEQWTSRRPCGTQRAPGLSVLLELRAELWLGRSVSLLVPTVAFTIPVARPHFDAVSDEQGEVLKAYDLDLSSARIGTGLIIHF